MQAQLCQQLIRSVLYICFCFFTHKIYNRETVILVADQAGYIQVFWFSTYKNCNARAAMPASFQTGCTFTLPLVKITMREKLCQQLVKPVPCTRFRFFACNNYNSEAAVPRDDVLVVGVSAICILAARALLSHKLLTVFVFSLAKIVSGGNKCRYYGYNGSIFARNR